MANLGPEGIYRLTTDVSNLAEQRGYTYSNKQRETDMKIFLVRKPRRAQLKKAIDVESSNAVPELSPRR